MMFFVDFFGFARFVENIVELETVVLVFVCVAWIWHIYPNRINWVAKPSCYENNAIS